MARESSGRSGFRQGETQRKRLSFHLLLLALPCCGTGFLLTVRETNPGLSKLMDACDLQVKGSVLVSLRVASVLKVTQSLIGIHKIII